jgi:lysine 2,3-aminomutase
MRTKVIASLSALPQLDEREKQRLQQVVDRFSFQASEHYLSLIDWDDPDDPIRRLILPDAEELHNWGRLDASNEQDHTVIPGLQHKYASTALLLVSTTCGGICRYCFRKRIFLENRKDHLSDLTGAVDYLRRHREITNVLITGGDPLTLPPSRLETIIGRLMDIDHIRIIRIGTKMLAFDPNFVVEDPSLPALIRHVIGQRKQVYIMNHFDHRREITEPSVEGLRMLREAGAVLLNQTPLIRGVNDSPEALADLFRTLTAVGVSPYYVFQCRPALGNKPFSVPIEEGYKIFETAKSLVSGLAKQARFVMSHAEGKIEVVGMTEHHTFFKFHRSADDLNSGSFLVRRCNPLAHWFDDYEQPGISAPAMGRQLGGEDQHRAQDGAPA